MSGWERRGRVVRHRALGEANVTEVEYPAGSVLRAHSHSDSYVSILVEGCYVEVRDAVPTVCEPGTVLRHVSNEEHADYFRSAARCLNVEFPDGWLASSGGDDHRTTAAAVRAVARSLRAGREAGVPDDLRGAVARLLTLPAGAQPREVPHWLAAAVRDFDWTDARPLTDAARTAGVHPAHFARAFRQHLGTTPVAYRHSRRVEAASRMLLQSSASLSAVAHENGFHDQSHFSNVFRRACGMSPGQYRAVFAR